MRAALVTRRSLASGCEIPAARLYADTAARRGPRENRVFEGLAMVTYGPISLWYMLYPLDPASLGVLTIVTLVCVVGVLRLMSDLW